MITPQEAWQLDITILFFQTVFNLYWWWVSRKAWEFEANILEMLGKRSDGLYFHIHIWYGFIWVSQYVAYLFMQKFQLIKSLPSTHLFRKPYIKII